MTTVLSHQLVTPDVPRLAAHDITIRRERCANPNAHVALYGDSEWSLEALPRTPGAARRVTLRFDRLPSPFQDAAKHLAYLTINEPTPQALLKGASSRSVEWPSPQTVRQRVGYTHYLVRWLASEGVRNVMDIDQEHLRAFAEHVIDLKGQTANTKNRRLESVVRWAAWGPLLPTEFRIPTPDWAPEPYAVKSQARSDNRTARIPQDTMRPLLHWAATFIDAYSADMIAAYDLACAWRDYEPDAPQSLTQAARIRAMFQGYIDRDEALPMSATQHGQLAGDYLRASHGLNDVKPSTLSTIYTKEYADLLPIERRDMPVAPLSITCPAEYEGLLHPISFYDCVPNRAAPPRIMTLLQTACIIVTAYLTGMRSDELRTLKPGCCPPPFAAADGTIQFRVNGTVAKRHALDTGLNTGMKERIPAQWATIGLVSRAIAVAESIHARITPDAMFLFASPSDSAEPVSSPLAAQMIGRFIDHVNDQLSVRDEAKAFPMIPIDEAGDITLSRFRRTLAWFIRRQPGGEVTLAVQYQHVGIVIGEGYAGAQESGMQDLLDEEGRNTRLDLLAHVAASLADGQGVSGPAARRLIASTEKARGIDYMSEKALRVLLRDPAMDIHDNPASLALCVFVPDQAQCRKLRLAGKSDQPNLLDCRPTCLNRVMTDEQATMAESRAEELRHEADMSPLPLQARLLQEAEALASSAATHWTSPIAPPPSDQTDTVKAISGQTANEGEPDL